MTGTDDSGIPQVPATARVRGVLICLVPAIAMAAISTARDGELGYDGAVYLERGLIHAEQVAQRGFLALPHLLWSLMFEAPKPPLFHGLVAATALLAGREHLSALIFAAAVIPAFLLTLAVWELASVGGKPGAGCYGVATLFAMPLVVEMSGRLMVETTLTALVTWGAVAAIRMGRSGNRVGGWIGLGVVLGSSALTKLPGPAFAAPLLILAAVKVARRGNVRNAVRGVLLALGVATLLAGPWYLRNGRAAIDFGVEAANSWAHEDAGESWARPFRLLLAAFGWPLGSTLIAVGISNFRAWRNRDGATRQLAFQVISVSLVTAAAVVVPRNFEPRFWMPCLGLVAAWGGRELDSWAGSRQRRLVLVFGLGALVAFAASQNFRATPAPAPWGLTSQLNQRFADRGPGALLCNLGESPAWNRYKMRLMAELSTIRPRPAVLDLLHEAPTNDLEATVARCDLVFLLDPREIPQDRSQIRQNVGLMDAQASVRRHSMLFEEDLSLQAAIETTARVEVLRRRADDPRRRSLP